MVMSELLKFLSLSNPSDLCSDLFIAKLCRPGVINKDPTVWLNGARPHPKYVYKNKMSLTNSKFDQIGHLLLNLWLFLGSKSQPTIYYCLMSLKLFRGGPRSQGNHYFADCREHQLNGKVLYS